MTSKIVKLLSNTYSLICIHKHTNSLRHTGLHTQHTHTHTHTRTHTHSHSHTIVTAIVVPVMAIVAKILLPSV